MHAMPDSKQRLDRILAQATDPSMDAIPLRFAGILFEHAMHATLLLDVDGTVLLANAAWEELLGERGIGRHLTEVVREAERSAMLAQLDAWRREGAIGVLRCEHALAARSARTISWSIQALRGAQREPIALLAGVQDITARVELERRLARTAALHDAMLATATDPIVLIDAQGIVRAASRSVEDMFGWTRAELIGQNVSVLMTEPHRSQHDGYLRHSLESGHSSVLGKIREFVVCRRDGRLITCELSAFRLDLAEEQPMFCGFFRDASERKRVQAQEATHLAALGTIVESASILAHELKNPITGLRHALRAVANHLGASEQEILGELADRMQRLERRMRRTLAFVRSPEVHRERCDLVELARDVASDLRQTADAKGAEIEVLSASAVHAEVDAPLLQDVLTNLLLNALDAIEDGGLIRIGVARSGAEIEMRVEDNGRGIPPSIRDELFRPFVTSKAGGTGLGLMICKRIIEAHGGSIRADHSELGGAAFVLTLPA